MNHLLASQERPRHSNVGCIEYGKIVYAEIRTSPGSREMCTSTLREIGTTLRISSADWQDEVSTTSVASLGADLDHDVQTNLVAWSAMHVDDCF